MGEELIQNISYSVYSLYQQQSATNTNLDLLLSQVGLVLDCLRFILAVAVIFLVWKVITIINNYIYGFFTGI